MLNLTTIIDNNILVWLAIVTWVVLNGSNGVPARDHFAKDDVLAVKMGRVGESQEELRAVRVRARVGHGEVTAG
jgi:hypothetical protein